MIKRLKYFPRLLLTYLWDIRYFFEYGLKTRVQSETYKAYISTKLYPEYMKRGNAAKFITPIAQQFCIGDGVDIGASKWPVFSARAIDNNENENAYKINEKDESLDYIFSSHLLEHLDEPAKALKEWSRVLKKDGHIFIYVPHPACEMWNSKILSHHIWDPSPTELRSIVSNLNTLEIVAQDPSPDAYLSHYIACRKI
tara:strand:- start:11480 stop:12073 length:594 start_codon:yes stop_codon:yes gene_type:complete